jgi:hypothetical protein
MISAAALFEGADEVLVAWLPGEPTFVDRGDHVRALKGDG